MEKELEEWQLQLTYETINGFTKEKMKQMIMERNNGTISVRKVYSRNPCAYRGDENNMCAIGVFIPDELYQDDMEGGNVPLLLKAYPTLTQYMPLDLNGLEEMQFVHDACMESDDVRQELINWIDEYVVDGSADNV